MSRSKKIFGGVAWSLILNIVNAGYGFISVPVLLSHYGKTQYGLIGVAMSINVYLRLLDMGFSSGNIKFFSGYLANNDGKTLNKLFQASLLFYIIIGFINTLVLVGISIYSQEIFSLSTEQDIIFKKLNLILIITSMGGWVGSVMEQFLRANELVGWQQRIMLLTKVCQIIALVATVLFTLDILSFFLLNTASSLIVLPFYIFKIRSLKMGISFLPKYDHEVFSKVLPYSMSIFSFSIFQFSANYLRPIILGVKVGIDSVSEYRIIEGFANLIMILGASFVGIMLPAATKVIIAGDKEKELQIAHDGTKYVTIFMSFLVFGFLLVSRDLMDLYVGKNYSYLVIWLNIWVITLFGTHNSALSSLVLSGNSLKPIVYLSAVSTFISLVSAWILVGYFQLGGVIIGYTIYVVSQLSFYYIYYYPKIMGYDSSKIFLRSFLLPVIIIGIAYGLISFQADFLGNIKNVYVKILLKEVLFVLIAGLSAFYLILNAKDKAFISKLIPQFSKKRSIQNVV